MIYQHEARGADAAITVAIDAYVEAERDKTTTATMVRLTRSSRPANCTFHARQAAGSVLGGGARSGRGQAAWVRVTVYPRASSWRTWLRTLRSGVDAAGVVVGSEVVEAGGGVGEQVPDDDQDGAGDRDQGLELAAALDDAPVAFAEEGVGLGGRGGGLAERRL